MKIERILTLLVVMAWKSKKVVNSLAQPKFKLQESQMMQLIDRITEINNVNSVKRFTPFFFLQSALESSLSFREPHGYLSRDFAKKLLVYADIFSFDNDAVYLQSKFSTAKSRTEALAHVSNDLRNQGFIKGWREELLPVVRQFSDSPIALVERAAYPWFGFKGDSSVPNNHSWYSGIDSSRFLSFQQIISSLFHLIIPS